MAQWMRPWTLTKKSLVQVACHSSCTFRHWSLSTLPSLSERTESCHPPVCLHVLTILIQSNRFILLYEQVTVNNNSNSNSISSRNKWTASPPKQCQTRSAPVSFSTKTPRVNDSSSTTMLPCSSTTVTLTSLLPKKNSMAICWSSKNGAGTLTAILVILRRESTISS